MTSRHAARYYGSHQGDGGDESEALVDFQHVRALVEQRLLLWVGPGLFCRKSEITHRGSALLLLSGSRLRGLARGLLLRLRTRISVLRFGIVG